LHALAGWFIFVLCLLMLLVMHRIIQAVYGRYHA
jgi:hypothetical protein